MSRTFSYLNQRLGPFTAILPLAALEGIIGIFFMDLLAAGVIRLATWSISLTAPADQIAALFGAISGVTTAATAAIRCNHHGPEIA